MTKDEQTDDDSEIEIIDPEFEALAVDEWSDRDGDGDPPELDHDEALAAEADDLAAATAQPAMSPLVEALGVEVDDLAVAELGATGGPVYDLSELGDVNEVGQLLDVLDSMNVRWAMDRAGQLVVHYNDETRVDEMMDRVFGEDDDWDDEFGEADQVVGPTALPVEVDSALGTSTVNATFDVSMPEPPVDEIEVSSGINDVHGRPTVDDMMSPPIQTSGTPWWLAVVAVVVLVVVFIMFVV